MKSVPYSEVKIGDKFYDPKYGAWFKKENFLFLYMWSIRYYHHQTNPIVLVI